MFRRTLLAALFLGAGLTAGLVLTGRMRSADTASATAVQTPPAARSQAAPPPAGGMPDLTAVAQRAIGSVTNISSTQVVRTPNSELWNSSEGFHSEYTYITEGGARFLVDQGVKVVGVDYLSVEQFKKAGAPAHRALLGSGVIVIEGLNLSDAEAGQYEMYCLPLRLANGDGAPARVVLKR